MNYGNIVSKFTGDGKLNITIEPTIQCKSNCAICARKKIKSTENRYMPKEIMDKIFFHLSHDGLLDNINNLYLGGWGNPLQYPDSISLINRAYNELNMKFSININGSILNKDDIHALLGSKVGTIIYSLNAVDESTYDKLMTRDRFELSLDNLLYLLEMRADMDSKFNLVIQVFNPWSHDDSSLMKRLNKYLNDESVSISLRTVENISGYIKVNGIELKQNFNKLPCAYLWRMISIDCDGNVYYCCAGSMIYRKEADLCVGNIMDHSLIYFLTHEKRRHFQNLMLHGRIDEIMECANCDTPLSFQ